MTGTLNRKARFLAGFVVYFVALWLLWGTPVVYPLKIFVVLLHEASHAMVAVATGGTIQRIVLDPYQGGACYCPGGNALLTLSAGYLGSLAWGAALTEAARARRVPSQAVIGLIGGLVVALTALFVRSPFGLVFGLAFGLTLMVASRKVSPSLNRTLLLALGLTSSLYAILDIKSDVLDRPDLESDARMLADLTGIPTEAWGLAWIGIALVVTFLLFRRAWRKA